MMVSSHIISSMFVLLILNKLAQEAYPFSGLMILLSIIFSSLPDLDGLWIEKMKDHHQSYFHAPLFWVLISAILALFAPLWIPGLLLAQLAGHFVADYLTAFTAGIAWFYSFNKKESSFLPLHKELGNFAIFVKTKEDKEKRKRYTKAYYANKKYLLIEIIAVVLGIVSFIIGILKR